MEPTPAIPATRPSPHVPGDDAPLFHLVYVSSAVAPFSEADLLALLEHSRTNNARCGVTGLLLYHEGNFMQALEGPEPAVRSLHARIVTDPRHYGCITLIQGAIAARSFAGWSMGFRQLNVAHADSAPGYSDFLNYRNPLRAPPLEPGRAWQLLASFRRDIR
ncbi:BLUF domain-containing protein [Horticoccus sp. 23ND18S-11]|uniref:BLUF domain-containing protein n=1 Tax=Horticoccus sp. 23ND18S-11 TaxID=3391832 RepID=UPI0039C9E446